AQFNRYWVTFQKEVQSYMKNYSKMIDEDDLNSYAWNVLKNCPKGKITTLALGWSDRVLATKYNYVTLATYAHLLYKLGRTNEAIETQEKVVELADESRKSIFQKD